MWGGVGCGVGGGRELGLGEAWFAGNKDMGEDAQHFYIKKQKRGRWTGFEGGGWVGERVTNVGRRAVFFFFFAGLFFFFRVWGKGLGLQDLAAGVSGYVLSFILLLFYMATDGHPLCFRAGHAAAGGLPGQGRSMAQPHVLLSSS